MNIKKPLNRQNVSVVINQPHSLWNSIDSLLLRHDDCDGVSNHQPRDCWVNSLFRCRSKKTSKLRITGLCEGNSPVTGEFPAVTGEFPAQRTSNAEKDCIWWRHHVMTWETSNGRNCCRMSWYCYFVCFCFCFFFSSLVLCKIKPIICWLL